MELRRQGVRKLAACIASAACGAIPLATHAQSPAGIVDQKNYRIPAGSLTRALTLFTQAADVSLSYDPALVQGKSSPGLSGSYTVTAGFARLLDGSGLTAAFPVRGGYVLRALPPDAASEGETARPIKTLADVTVIGIRPNNDYLASTESLVAGTATPLQEIPQSVQVVSSDIIKDQQAQTLFDIVRNVGGMNDNPQIYGFATDAYELRGYGARVQLDGVAPQYTFHIPAAGIDRVEILKGSSSSVLGDTAHGGLINVVTKQPQRDPVREVSLQAGSFGDSGLALDVGDASSTDRRLQYRAVMSAEKANRNSAGFNGSNQLYLAPSLAWDDGQTRLVFGIQYARGRIPATPFTVAIDGRPAVLNGVIENDQEHTDFNQIRSYYQYTRKLNADWSIHSTASLIQQSATQYDYFIEPVDRLGNAFYLGQKLSFRQRDLDMDNSLTGKFTTGSATHNVTMGLAYFNANSLVTATENPWMNGNIFHPGVPLSSPVPGSTAADPNSSSDQDVVISAQDFISIGSRWHVLAAIAFNRAQSDGINSHAWTPKLGISYQASNLVSVYGSYIRSFSIQPTFLENGELAPPIASKTIEGGIKFGWPNKPLDLSIALFHVAQSQLAQAVPPFYFYRLTDGGNSQGLEINLQGRLAPGWKAIASYTYTDFHPASGLINQVPHHVASLWTTYTFPTPALRHWSVGAGMYSQSAYTGDGQGFDDFQVSGQTRTDFSLFYRGKGFSATLGIKNVFDRTLYAGHATAEQTFLEPGRTILLTTSYAF